MMLKSWSNFFLAFVAISFVSVYGKSMLNVDFPEKADPDGQVIVNGTVFNGTNVNVTNVNQTNTNVTYVNESNMNVTETSKRPPTAFPTMAVTEAMLTCGKRFFEQGFGLQRARIVGGEDAVKGAYPWQVSLRFFGGKEYSHYCGGTIIGERHIITAAHCVMTELWNPTAIVAHPHLFPIFVGDHKLHNYEKSQRALRIADIYVHKEYSDITLQNDIAIIKTIEKIEYNEYVQPACLAFGQNLDLYEPGTEAIISGWGSTLRTEKDGKNAETRNPNILQAAKLEIIDVRACNETYKVLTNDMVCAGYFTGYPLPGACYGDSGGPLVVEKQGRFYLTGIVSFGIGCGRVGFPAIFTKVSSYEDWIVNHAKC